MRIVIDISDDDYRKVQDGRASVVMMRNAIRNGTPLPEGHGRLIDADIAKEKMGNLDGYGFVGKCLDEIPTIIEADKESEVKV